MRAVIYYFTKDAFLENPHMFFTDAHHTEDLLRSEGLKGFVMVDTHEDKSVKSKREYAEKLFIIYNDGTEEGNPLGTPAGQQKIRSSGVGHTSMSINDFVVIDGDVLIVDSEGFKELGKLYA